MTPKQRTKLKDKLKRICRMRKCTRLDIVKKHYGGIIPLSKSWQVRYAHINNMLNPNGMCAVKQWLVELIEAEEEA